MRGGQRQKWLGGSDVKRDDVYHSIGEMRRVVMITITIPGIGNRLKLERETQIVSIEHFKKPFQSVWIALMMD